MIALEEAAQGFAAAGSEPRLTVLLALVKAGGGGLSVGEIQERVGIPASTLAHHLKFLAAAGLVEQEKLGRTILNRAAYDRVQALAEFLTHECCTQPGEADVCCTQPDDGGACCVQPGEGDACCIQPNEGDACCDLPVSASRTES
jgi:ArsR family transcriptional regulator